ncbi:TIGR00730 family Rossman fold protein [Candidatus Pandoraea novymonadis]|uniref:Cytokinin riboside 5'-monophosphate phosphoribohydrolase n=1 Tax=Candidatus Pandoraea novymonadis TaxID=1808959 RepID=A0ABX5FGG7_9BURK|nr:TIGR00730 family Rossman fold protein [Candidatus Pandoraea novymonadis]PSB92292.1 Cytokinin riboside 5'-monophosphate phosphoribohydrolase [Candidatus Pandoraea novymonadis]
MTKKRKVISSLRILAGHQYNTTKKADVSLEMTTIMSEFIEGTEYLSEIRPAVSIYGSARIKTKSLFYKLAMKIAEKFSNAGFAVISGGGPGIMEAANKGAHGSGSPSIGLNIELPHEQKKNQYQDISLRFQHFFTRKITFVKNSDAFIILPGGFGTLDELSEVITLIQTKKFRHVPIILVGSEFWKGLLDWIKHSMLSMELIADKDLDLIQVIDDPDEILKAVLNFYETIIEREPSCNEKTFHL